MMNWETGIGVGTLPCVKQLEGACCVAQGVQFRVLWKPRQPARGRVGQE